MSKAGAFGDYFNSGAALDENTVITDYWLDFVTVREEMDEPTQTQTQTATEELYNKVQDLGHRIEALLEGRRQIQIELERFSRNDQPLSKRPLHRESGNPPAHAPARSAAPARPHEPYRPVGEIDDAGARRNWSLADRLRNSFLYTTIRKLR